jgi:hypothetical protein
MSKVFNTILREDGICYSKVAAGAIVEIEDAKYNTQMVKTVSNGKKPPILIDIREIISITKEARDHFSMRNREAGVTAIGLLIKSPVSRVIGNFYLGINKPTVPTKLFTDEKKALGWLSNYVL